MSVLRQIRYLLELIRFSHTVFALPFALLSAAMATFVNFQEEPPIWPRWQDVLGILVCMVCARSAAMAFNRLVDRKFDAQNPRTANRHLITGVVSTRTVVLFLVVMSFGFILGTALFLPRNPIPIVAAVPVLLFLFAYSYTKRFTVLSHFWLGAALMLAPLAAWVALRPEFHWAPVLLGIGVLLWVAGFDIIYACQDAEFDRKVGLHSIPAKLGIRGALRVAAACHALMLLALVFIPHFFPAFGIIYYAGVVVIAMLLLVEHRLVSPNDLSRANVAFFNVNAVVSIGLFAVGVLDIIV